MRKVTQQSIADKFGTTKNTVSKALRGKPGVGDELRNKILEAARQHGYRQKGHTPLQFTMVGDSRFMTDTYFWAELMGGALEYSTRFHISIRTLTMDMLKDDVEQLLPLQGKYCDGILVMGSIRDTLFARIAELNIPIVAVDHFSNMVECDYINVANQDGGTKAVDFLVKHNHTNIGYINNIAAPHTYSFTQRYLGFCNGMAKFGLAPNPQWIWPNAVYNDLHYLREMLDKIGKNMPTAWVCANDLTAYNFCEVLQERGLQVPGDISIVGFDNMNGYYNPKLTTLEIPKKAIGRRAVEKLMHRLKNPCEPFENIEFITRLVDKGTVKFL